MINLHTDLDTLRLGGTGAKSELEGAENVSAETSRRLACDAGVVQWLNQRKTPIPGWLGERMDVGTVIDGLLGRE